MKSNFQIEKNYALTYEGRHIDLHNNFDFVGYNYDIIKRQITLNWSKSKGDWVKENEFHTLLLIHTNVIYIAISYDSKNDELSSDDTCLSDVSFFPSEDRQTNDRVVAQETPLSTDDIIYSFQSEHFIRVGCEKIELICK